MKSLWGSWNSFSLDFIQLILLQFSGTAQISKQGPDLFAVTVAMAVTVAVTVAVVVAVAVVL